MRLGPLWAGLQSILPFRWSKVVAGDYNGSVQCGGIPRFPLDQETGGVGSIPTAVGVGKSYIKSSPGFLGRLATWGGDPAVGMTPS